MDVVRIDSHQPLSCVIITDGSLSVSLISAYVFFLFLASLRSFTEKITPPSLVVFLPSAAAYLQIEHCC